MDKEVKDNKNNNFSKKNNEDLIEIIDFEIENLSFEGEKKLDESLSQNDNNKINNNDAEVLDENKNEHNESSNNNDDIEDLSDESNDSNSNNNDSEADNNLEENDDTETLDNDNTEDLNSENSDENNEKKDDSEKEKNDESEKEKPDNEEKSDDNKDDLNDQKDSSKSDENSKNKDSNEPKDNQENNNQKDSNNQGNKPKNENNKPSESSQNKEPQKNKSAADNKRQEAADKQQSRKNKAKNNAKNGAPKPKGIKNRAKSAASNVKNKAKDKVNEAKENVKNDIKESVDEVKQKIEKTKKIISIISKVAPAFGIVFGIIILIAVIVSIASSLFPGFLGSAQDEKENYTETNKKVLDKLQDRYNNHSNSNGPLALFTVAYPYFPELWGPDVLRLVDNNAVYNDLEDEADEDDESLSSDQEELETSAEDDQYVALFSKLKYRTRFTKLLKKYSSLGEDGFYQYLKDTYFEKNSYGYKDLLKQASDKEQLKESIIQDLKENYYLFSNYLFENMSCSTSKTSLGYSDGGNLNGDVRVSIVDARTCSGGCSNAPVITDKLTLKDYTIGVVVAEIGDWASEEAAAKSQMILAKSFVVQRTKPEIVGDMTVFRTTSSQNDQVYCDSTIGSKCYNGIIMTQELYDRLGKWYDETAGEFLFDTSSNRYVSSYVNDSSNYNQYCTKGSCYLQKDAYNLAKDGMDYYTIIKTFFTSDSIVIKNIETNELAALGTPVCTNIPNFSCEIPDGDFIYYSQRSYDNAFCGRTDGTIRSSGCGVTSMAMIISNLSGVIVTPVDTMNEAHQGGYCGDDIPGTAIGYFSAAAKKYGLTYSATTDTNVVKDHLKDGGLIIAHVGHGWKTTEGHYLVIKGITNDDKLIIADPMDTSYNSVPSMNYLTIAEFNKYVKTKYYLFKSDKSVDIKEKYCSSKGQGYMISPIGESDNRDFLSKTHPVGSSIYYPNYSNGTCHGAIDIPLATGTPIYAVDGGTITETFNNSNNCAGHCVGNQSFGIGIKINHENGYETWYAHLSKKLVEKGQRVEKGELIGYSGNTGNSYGAHLHLALKNIELYNKTGDYQTAKCGVGKGFMNPAKYINSSTSYVGQTE